MNLLLLSIKLELKLLSNKSMPRRGSFGVLFPIGELIKILKRENYTVVILKKIRNKKSVQRRVFCGCLVTAYELAVRGRTPQTPIIKISNPREKVKSYPQLTKHSQGLLGWGSWGGEIWGETEVFCRARPKRTVWRGCWKHGDLWHFWLTRGS